MKIALVHYRWFHGDGPERYCFNIKEMLERKGHCVVPFSIKNSRNLPAPPFDECFFLEAVDDEVRFGESGHMSVSKVLRSFARMYWSREAARRFDAFLEFTKPDVVYILQYHNKISPSILGPARRRGIPVVHRISDYQYICPNAVMNANGKICEDCLNGRRLSCIRRRCVHGSAVKSALKLGAKIFHDAMRTTRRIDAFVVPSRFTVSKLHQYGISLEKLHHIPTFFNTKSGQRPEPVAYEPFMLYVGRISAVKGVETLVKAFADTDMHLKIVGASSDGLDERLKASLKGHRHNIEFLGYLPFEEIAPQLARCRATIVPSECYDNFPNSILESFGFSKPVIATAVGSLKETVIDGQTGLTFPLGDAEALRRTARSLMDDEAAARRMGAEGRRRIEEIYSPEVHYDALISLFEQLRQRS